jgi:putative transposase
MAETTQHHRRSIRLKGYDYTKDGLYFVTICTHNRECYFGNIEKGIMILDDTGQKVFAVWNEIPEHFPCAVLHEFVIMPNHIHGIIEIKNNNGNKYSVEANNHSPLQNPHIKESIIDHDTIDKMVFKKSNGTSRTVGSIIRGFKIGVTKWVKNNANIPTVWQRNYYEHIIRDEASYCHITEYIRNNPVKWNEDGYNDR